MRISADPLRAKGSKGIVNFLLVLCGLSQISHLWVPENTTYNKMCKDFYAEIGTSRVALKGVVFWVSQHASGFDGSTARNWQNAVIT